MTNHSTSKFSSSATWVCGLSSCVKLIQLKIERNNFQPLASFPLSSFPLSLPSLPPFLFRRAGVGKTSIINRFVQDSFSSKYKSTIGVDFALKTIKLETGEYVRLQLWDLSGQERFSNLSRIYMKDAAAAIVVFDITSLRTLHGSEKWKKEIDTKGVPSSSPFDPSAEGETGDGPGPSITTILVANKNDLKSEKIPREQIERVCEQNAFASWFETSAKTGHQIDEIFMFLISKIVPNYRPPQKIGFYLTDAGEVYLNDNLENGGGGGKKSCSC